MRAPAFGPTPPLVASDERRPKREPPAVPPAPPARTDDVSGAALPAADVDGGSAIDEPGDDNDETVAGGSGASDEADAEADEAQPPPSRVADLAEACVRFIAARYGTTLDYEPDTLSFVDQWVRDARTEMGRRPEVAELVQSAAGAYLGEVVRRAFGGFWVTGDEGDTAAWRLCLSRVYCAFNPLGMMREALLLDRADGWNAHLELDPAERDVMEQRLDALPAASDDEFFAPSTRFDVVSIVHDALHAAMEAEGLGDVRFTRDDY